VNKKNLNAPSTLIYDNTYPVLYSFRRCPYAMRARLAIARAQVLVELREIELRNKPESLLLASPKGTVPVLLLGTVKSSMKARILCSGLYGNTIPNTG
jgi:glutathione S-transferase